MGFGFALNHSIFYDYGCIIYRAGGKVWPLFKFASTFGVAIQYNKYKDIELLIII